MAQTKSEAAIEIIGLLLVSAIIGYVTAWLYTRSVFMRKIKVAETEKDSLKNIIVALNADKSNLYKRLHEKELETEEMAKKINNLESVNAEYLNDEGPKKFKSNMSVLLSDEDDDTMHHFARQKHLLNYLSFGTASEAEKDDLTMISGIGTVIEARLNVLDIYTYRQISRFTPADIEAIDNAIIYFSDRIDRDKWVEQARELIQVRDTRSALFKRISDRKSDIRYNRIGFAKSDEADDLTLISGIGGWIAEKLNALDIYTFRQISNFTGEDIITVTEALEYFPGRIERDEWITQARELIRIAGDKSDLLKRIRDRKGRIFYDRFGVAHKYEANNLTLIDGLGLWVEERLNMLGIYTFSQVSKLTREDIDTITEVLEIIPGCIEKDNWVGQARELAKKHLVVV
jgi:predicted flap endonuclease-1-like 5' DNA nuclease